MRHNSNWVPLAIKGFTTATVNGSGFLIVDTQEGSFLPGQHPPSSVDANSFDGTFVTNQRYLRFNFYSDDTETRPGWDLALTSVTEYALTRPVHPDELQCLVAIKAPSTSTWSADNHSAKYVQPPSTLDGRAFNAFAIRRTDASSESAVHAVRCWKGGQNIVRRVQSTNEWLRVELEEDVTLDGASNAYIHIEMPSESSSPRQWSIELECTDGTSPTLAVDSDTRHLVVGPDCGCVLGQGLYAKDADVHHATFTPGSRPTITFAIGSQNVLDWVATDGFNMQAATQSLQLTGRRAPYDDDGDGVAEEDTSLYDVNIVHHAFTGQYYVYNIDRRTNAGIETYYHSDSSFGYPGKVNLV